MSKVRSAPDFVIIFATLFLLGIGIVMVYSASAIVAQKAPFNDPYFFHNGNALILTERGLVLVVQLIVLGNIREKVLVFFQLLLQGRPQLCDAARLLVHGVQTASELHGQHHTYDSTNDGKNKCDFTAFL